MKSLKSPVKAEAFYPARMTDSINNARALLEKYLRVGRDKFSFEFIDPEREPLKAKAATYAGQLAAYREALAAIQDRLATVGDGMAAALAAP